MTTIHIRPMSDNISAWLSLLEAIAHTYSSATVIGSWDSATGTDWLDVTIQKWEEEDRTFFKDLIEKDLIAHWAVAERN